MLRGGESDQREPRVSIAANSEGDVWVNDVRRKEVVVVEVGEGRVRVVR